MTPTGPSVADARATGRSILAAFLVTPFVIPLVYGVAWQFWFSDGIKGLTLARYFEYLLQSILFALWWGLPAAVIIELIFGLPLWFLRRRYTRMRFVWVFMAAAIVATALFFFCLGVITNPTLLVNFKLSAMVLDPGVLFLLLGGALSGLVFAKISLLGD